MTQKTTQSLDDLRAQARLTYRYWPIYLMLRLREAEQHLTPDQRRALPAGIFAALDVSRLVTYGLWDSDLPTPKITPPPQLTILDGTTLQIQAVAGDSASLLAQSDGVQVVLMHSPADTLPTLQQIAAQFTAMSREYPAQTVLDNARLWAALHGARSLDWEAISAASDARQDDLPPRKRGRGSFRTPFSS